MKTMPVLCNVTFIQTLSNKNKSRGTFNEDCVRYKFLPYNFIKASIK